MAGTTGEMIYDRHIRQLPAAEQLRIVERIAQELSSPDQEIAESYDWMAVRGIAPSLLGSQDAQEWVSALRRDSDAHRELSQRG